MNTADSEERIPLRMITPADLQACKTEGKCCQCSACCRVWEVYGIPKVGEAGPGSVRMKDGSVETYRKLMGHRCGHLVLHTNEEDGKQTYGCGLHDSPHQPSVCRNWRGNQNLFPLEGVRFDEFLLAAKGMVLWPNNAGEIAELRVLVDNGTLQSLFGDLYIFDGKDSVENFLQRWIVRLETMDTEIFDIAKLPFALQKIRWPGLEKMAQDLCLSRENPLHRQFLEHYIDPLLPAD